MCVCERERVFELLCGQSAVVAEGAKEFGKPLFVAGIHIMEGKSHPRGFFFLEKRLTRPDFPLFPRLQDGRAGKGAKLMSENLPLVPSPDSLEAAPIPTLRLSKHGKSRCLKKNFFLKK